MTTESDTVAGATIELLEARLRRLTYLLTGATDYLSDGERVVAVSNGHELLGQVTGVGIYHQFLWNMLTKII